MKTSKPLLDLLQHRKVTKRPVWLMRQAGRYLPEYRELRSKAGSFLELCYHPEMAAEVTLQPLRRFDLDAAILFSDILVVPQAMGLNLKFVENEGPVLGTVASMADVLSLKGDGPFSEFISVAKTVALVKASLEPSKTLIGFCGAPWTVASYMIEGGSSDRKRARAIAASGVDWFSVLLDKLVDVSLHYLDLQIAAGAEVIQIFDSWAGDLPIGDQLRFVDAPIARMVSALKVKHPNVPVIVFARGVGARHVEIAKVTNADAISLEQDADIAAVIKALPQGVAAQGNLSPKVILEAGPDLERSVLDIVKVCPIDRHIFNLGHGIEQKTDPESVVRVIRAIRDFDGVRV